MNQYNAPAYGSPAPQPHNPYQPPANVPFPMGGGSNLGLGMYEFDAAQNRILRSAATWTLALGIILLVQAVLQLVQIAIFGALANGAMGTMLILTSGALRKVVSTQGQDVPYLMKALSNFSNMLLFRSILFLLAIALIGGIAALVVVAKLAGA